MLAFLFRLLSKLPLPVLHALGAALGWLVYLASPPYRRRMLANLRQAGHARHLRAAIAESGKSVMELPFVWCAAPERVQRHTRVENWELVQAQLDAGRGVLFLTPHLGCFELTAQAIARHTPLTVMYRPPRKAALKPLVEGARARHNLKLAAATLGGVRVLAKALKKGEPVGLLPDQVPQHGEGVWADFFGQPAYSMTLPGKLRQMTDAVFILVYAERLPGGQGFTVRFVPFDGEPPEGAERQAGAVNAAMERLIARCPAQYFWSYNRYKVPPDVAPPQSAADPQSARRGQGDALAGQGDVQTKGQANLSPNLSPNLSTDGAGQAPGRGEP